MTINVAVVTSEALILGCDSIASTTRHLLDPFSFERTPTGEGRFSIDFAYDDMIQLVSNAWGGVTKMFPLRQEENGACVAAITAGLARFNDRTMSGFAEEFMKNQHAMKQPRVNVEAVAKDFLRFLRKEYTRHYASSSIPEAFLEGPEFLVGGYGRDDQLPSLYRVKIKENTVECEYKSGVYGISWAGQSDAVVRLIHGYDIPLRTKIDEEVKSAIDDIYDSTSAAVTNIIQSILDKLDVEMPNEVNTKLPAKKDVQLSWSSCRLPVLCQSWPTQDAVDYASFLVYMQSARAKFVPGVATVGGRTHIGVLTKGEGFTMLKEPELKHRNVGFSDDL